MTTTGPAPVSRSTFVTAVARSLILLSAGMLLALVLLHLLGRPDTGVVSSSLAGTSGAFRFYVSHMQLVSIANLALWVLTLVSAVGLLKRGNWARVLLTAIIGFHILYDTLGVIFFPWNVFASAPISLSTIRPAGTVLAVLFLGLLVWLLVKLLSSSIRAEFFSGHRAA